MFCTIWQLAITKNIIRPLFQKNFSVALLYMKESYSYSDSAHNRFFR